MTDVKEPYYVNIIDDISHQNIGGKTMRIEKEGTINYFLDTKYNDFTIAMYNFMLRCNDIFNILALTIDTNMKIYYGHIENLGYFIAEDEIKEVIR